MSTSRFARTQKRHPQAQSSTLRHSPTASLHSSASAARKPGATPHACHAPVPLIPSSPPGTCGCGRGGSARRTAPIPKTPRRSGAPRNRCAGASMKMSGSAEDHDGHQQHDEQGFPCVQAVDDGRHHVQEQARCRGTGDGEHREGHHLGGDHECSSRRPSSRGQTLFAGLLLRVRRGTAQTGRRGRTQQRSR